MLIFKPVWRLSCKWVLVLFGTVLLASTDIKPTTPIITNKIKPNTVLLSPPFSYKYTIAKNQKANTANQIDQKSTHKLP
ncbi:hypothetical protein LP109_04615 [Moraxella bovis]|uniref:hypothetical protein n=1 Tax=Moraxella bovis TaxID=476 RepID=UPI00117D29C3|nr:hypothetical protein [Moraxella bovis]UYZ93698.1 hypothetical protein LP121_07175 [Moraxella bovis]UZA17582.1 hypothetical protein LP109_04615 [Moraxella bovis]UZA26069.1 hypothetical protein LP117_06435 [Moraxella bovis]UZA31035.1 hypothetical protein LP097_05350 [Moraxella bovis]